MKGLQLNIPPGRSSGRCALLDNKSPETVHFSQLHIKEQQLDQCSVLTACQLLSTVTSLLDVRVMPVRGAQNRETPLASAGQHLYDVSQARETGPGRHSTTLLVRYGLCSAEVMSQGLARAKRRLENTKNAWQIRSPDVKADGCQHGSVLLPAAHTS